MSVASWARQLARALTFARITTPFMVRCSLPSAASLEPRAALKPPLYGQFRPWHVGAGAIVLNWTAVWRQRGTDEFYGRHFAEGTHGMSPPKLLILAAVFCALLAGVWLLTRRVFVTTPRDLRHRPARPLPVRFRILAIRLRHRKCGYQRRSDRLFLDGRISLDADRQLEALHARGPGDAEGLADSHCFRQRHRVAPDGAVVRLPAPRCGPQLPHL